MPRRVHYLFLLLFIGFAGCREARTEIPPVTTEFKPLKEKADVPAHPPATSDLPLQEQDYAEVRKQFQTKLLRKGPAPQPGQRLKLRRARRKSSTPPGICGCVLS